MIARDKINVANDDMRTRIVTIASRIADELAVLSRTAVHAPNEARVAVLDAVAKMANAQEQLLATTHRLPASPEERFALMQSLLQAQQGALKQLGFIVKQYGPAKRSTNADGAMYKQRPVIDRRRVANLNHKSVSARLPPSVDSADLTAANSQDGPQYGPLPVQLTPDELAHAIAVAQRIHADELGLPFGTLASDNPDALPVHRPRAQSQRRTDRKAAPAKARAPRALQHGLVLLKSAASRSLSLVAILGLGLLVAYGTFPRASGQAELTTRKIELPARVVDAATSLAVPRAEPTESADRSPLPPRVALAPNEVVRETTSDPSAASRPLPETSPRLVPLSPAVVPATASLATLLPTAPLTRTLSQDKRDPQVAAVQTSRGQTTEAANATAIVQSSSSGEQFVAVLLTDKEQAAVKQAFAALQQRYPMLLQQRQSEVQAVDAGQKGVWHRLIVLPPGSRQQASALCQQLMGAGYDRCWVKVY